MPGLRPVSVCRPPSRPGDPPKPATLGRPDLWRAPGTHIGRTSAGGEVTHAWPGYLSPNPSAHLVGAGGPRRMRVRSPRTSTSARLSAVIALLLAAVFAVGTAVPAAADSRSEQRRADRLHQQAKQTQQRLGANRAELADL